jgi:hypothetical protein
MMRWLGLLAFALAAPFAHSQQYGLYQTCQLQTPMGQAVAGAQVYFLAQPASTTTLTPQAQVYSSSTGGTVSQPILTNGQGTCSAYLSPGTYTVCYVSPYTGTQCNPDQNVPSPTPGTYAVTSVTILTGGDYSVCPTAATFTGGEGEGAAGTPVCTGTAVTGVTMTSGGSYINVPSVSFTGGTGAGAAGVANLTAYPGVVPIVTGGTGATNAATGLSNLGGLPITGGTGAVKELNGTQYADQTQTNGINGIANALANCANALCPIVAPSTYGQTELSDYSTLQLFEPPYVYGSPFWLTDTRFGGVYQTLMNPTPQEYTNVPNLYLGFMDSIPYYGTSSSASPVQEYIGRWVNEWTTSGGVEQQNYNGQQSISWGLYVVSGRNTAESAGTIRENGYVWAPGDFDHQFHLYGPGGYENSADEGIAYHSDVNDQTPYVPSGTVSAVSGNMVTVNVTSNNGRQGERRPLLLTASPAALTPSAVTNQYYVTSVATFTSVAAASGGNTVYTGTVTTAITAQWTVGTTQVIVSGFDLSANNGTFTYEGSTGTTMTLANGSGVVDTHAGTAAATLAGSVYGHISSMTFSSVPTSTGWGVLTQAVSAPPGSTTYSSQNITFTTLGGSAAAQVLTCIVSEASNQLGNTDFIYPSSTNSGAAFTATWTKAQPVGALWFQGGDCGKYSEIVADTTPSGTTWDNGESESVTSYPVMYPWMVLGSLDGVTELYATPTAEGQFFGAHQGFGSRWGLGSVSSVVNFYPGLEAISVVDATGNVYTGDFTFNVPASTGGFVACSPQPCTGQAVENSQPPAQQHSGGHISISQYAPFGSMQGEIHEYYGRMSTNYGGNTQFNQIPVAQYNYTPYLQSNNNGTDTLPVGAFYAEGPWAASLFSNATTTQNTIIGWFSQHNTTYDTPILRPLLYGTWSNDSFSYMENAGSSYGNSSAWDLFAGNVTTPIARVWSGGITLVNGGNFVGKILLNSMTQGQSMLTGGCNAYANCAAMTAGYSVASMPNAAGGSDLIKYFPAYNTWGITAGSNGSTYPMQFIIGGICASCSDGGFAFLGTTYHFSMSGTTGTLTLPSGQTIASTQNVVIAPSSTTANDAAVYSNSSGALADAGSPPVLDLTGCRITAPVLNTGSTSASAVLTSCPVAAGVMGVKSRFTFVFHVAGCTGASAPFAGCNDLASVTGLTGGSGSGTVTLSGFNNGCNNSTATVTLSSGAFSSAVVNTAGSGCTAAPTSATCTNGTATCPGSTATITTTIGAYTNTGTCTGIGYLATSSTGATTQVAGWGVAIAKNGAFTVDLQNENSQSAQWVDSAVTVASNLSGGSPTSATINTANAWYWNVKLQNSVANDICGITQTDGMLKQ